MAAVSVPVVSRFDPVAERRRGESVVATARAARDDAVEALAAVARLEAQVAACRAAVVERLDAVARVEAAVACAGLRTGGRTEDKTMGSRTHQRAGTRVQGQATSLA
ncbi:hypothetical protein [Specibacter cremeus]|uniref:hypothetical protein n=1 Tax=Specibacter cremeus TaxID=1629051 RepID=UPI00197BFB2A|nr:hypothetical protein [Specibacter cremeus]